MAKRIFPGNQSNRLSGYQNQCVIAEPGRAFYSVLGYASITSTPLAVWDITIPSPDLRADDKPRADRVGLILPAGACVYSLGYRIPDMRRDRSVGTAFSGLIGTNTERLKVADALANDNSITTTVVATSSALAPVALTTISPRQVRASLVTPPILAGAETMRIYLTAADGVTASTNLMTSSVVGGTPILVEVNYFLDDDVIDLEDIRLPFRVEN